MTIRIGLIGGGNISATHARAAAQIPGAEIVAIYGTNESKVHHLSRQYNSQAFHSFDEFLSHRPMDMVMIGTPSGVHAIQAIEAFRHGLHVLTKKPMDIPTKRADALIEAADKAGMKVGVIFQDRLKPAIFHLHRQTSAGALEKTTRA